MTSAVPSFSIVIEWDNARYAELQRTERMLRILSQQLADVRPAHPPEVFLVYDGDSIDGAVLEKAAEEWFDAEPSGATIRIVPTSGLHYYEQKNFGARLASGEIVILLDCDLVPEEGWLVGMLEAFRDPAVNVVAGETYIDCAGIYSKAFALFWYFSLRDDKAGLVSTDFFHANNVAFRASVFAAYPFPVLSAYRVQCTILGQRLLADGIGIHLQKAARASHPAPLGWYFVTRALNNGRDETLLSTLVARRPKLRHVYWNYRSCLARTARRFREGYRTVGLSPLGAVLAYAVAVAYFSFKAAGELLFQLRPEWATRLFPT